MEIQIFRLTYRNFGSAARNQDPAASRGVNGLQVYLLLVDDVLIVEGVFGVEFVMYAGWSG
jgi:hypothetical protein